MGKFKPVDQKSREAVLSPGIKSMFKCMICIQNASESAMTPCVRGCPDESFMSKVLGLCTRWFFRFRATQKFISVSPLHFKREFSLFRMKNEALEAFVSKSLDEPLHHGCTASSPGIAPWSCVVHFALWD